MLMLGISTSSKNPSAAVMDDGFEGRRILSFNIDADSGRSHSEVLMELIERSLNEAGIEKTDLNAVAVDIGPGSFTGVRIGVSCANAIAFALGIPVIPVCSLYALLASLPRRGCSAAIVDCRNGNCYAAVRTDGEETLAPCAAVTEEVLSMLPDDASICGDAACIDGARYPDAKLVLFEAARGNIAPAAQATPLYLRPSQAERMKKA